LLLAVVAGLAAAASLLGFLTRTMLVDTDQFVATVAPLGKDPVVVAAASQELTDQIVAAIGQQTTVSDPTVRSVARRTISSTIRTQSFQRAWVAVLKTAHGQIVTEVRRNQSGSVSVSLRPVAVKALNTMSGTIPGVTGLTDQLPATLGQVIVLDADQAATVRRSLHLLDLSLLGTSLTFVGATISTVLVAPSLRQAFIQIGLAVAGAAALQWVALHLLSAYLVAQVPTGVATDVAHRVADVLASDLLTGTAWLGLAGLVVAAVAGLWPRFRRARSS
jgi:hypothetical protein